MPVQHVKTDGIGDFTGTVTVFNSQGSTTTVAATNIVRPSDWNSNHQLVVNLSGNTLGSSQVAGTDVVWSGGSNVTLSADTLNSRIGIIGAQPPATLSSYAPFEIVGLNTTNFAASTSTSAQVQFWPITVAEYLNAGMLNLIGSFTFVTGGTSSGRQTIGYRFGLYSRGTGGSTSQLGTFDSNSYSIGITWNNSSVTISYPTSTDFVGYTYGTAGTASSNSSAFTGLKMIQVPIGQLLTPGVYWLAMHQTAITNSTTVGISNNWVGASHSFTALGGLGIASSQITTGTGFAVFAAGGPWGFGQGSWSTAGGTNLPDTVAISAMTAGAPTFPYMKFWST